MKNLYEQGQMIETTVAAISNDTVFIDLGLKSEGFVNKSEFCDENGNCSIKEGDKIKVYFLGGKNEELHFTTKLAGQNAGKSVLENAFKNGIPVEGHVTKEIKCGFEVMIGTSRAFCPYSQMGYRALCRSPLRGIDADEHAGNAQRAQPRLRRRKIGQRVPELHGGVPVQRAGQKVQNFPRPLRAQTAGADQRPHQVEVGPEDLGRLLRPVPRGPLDRLVNAGVLGRAAKIRRAHGQDRLLAGYAHGGALQRGVHCPHPSVGHLTQQVLQRGNVVVQRGRPNVQRLRHRFEGHAAQTVPVGDLPGGLDHRRPRYAHGISSFPVGTSSLTNLISKINIYIRKFTNSS